MSDENILNQQQDTDTLGGRISRAREAAGVSIEELAVQVAVDFETIEGWETDSLDPRSARLRNLAGVLGVSPTWLLMGIGTSPRGEDAETEVDILKAQVTQLETNLNEALKAVEQIKLSIDALDMAKNA